MVRSATYRTSKYAAKIVGDVIKNRIDAQKDSMVSQETAIFADMAAFETSIKTLLEGHNVPTTLIPFYMSFGRQCYKITKTHAGTTAHDEICLRVADWSSTIRGLFGPYLAEISDEVFNVDVYDCT